jgi:multiple sugar transport system permease protein
MFNLPFAIWLMKSFYDAIPVELEESCMVDGCTRLKAFLKITTPLSIGGIVATSLFTIFLSWNEFLFANTLTSTQARTITAYAATLVDPPAGVMYGLLSAIGTTVMIPMLLLAWSIQRHLAKGLTFGAVRE